MSNSTDISPGGLLPTDCRLMPGMFGVVTQVLLLTISVLALVGKKTLDRTERSCVEFFLDSSKQIIGSVLVHSLNLFFAVRMHKQHREGDSCDWYWINIVVDCTVGTLIELLLFQFCMHVVIPHVCSERAAAEFDSGEYAGTSTARLSQVSWRRYWKQLGLWLFICGVMKLVVVAIMRRSKRSLLRLASILLGPVQGNPEAKLLVVMSVTPVIFNTLQLWVIDNLIKRKPEKSKDRLHASLLVH